jgi:hypothetical protein
MQNFTDSASDDLINSGTRKGRKRSATEYESSVKLTAEEATHNDANGQEIIHEAEWFFNLFLMQFPRGARHVKCLPTLGICMRPVVQTSSALILLLSRVCFAHIDSFQF